MSQGLTISNWNKQKVTGDQLRNITFPKSPCREDAEKRLHYFEKGLLKKPEVVQQQKDPTSPNIDKRYVRKLKPEEAFDSPSRYPNFPLIHEN